MNRFFKLVNMELNRFTKILFGLIITVFIIQVAGLIIEANIYMSDANKSLTNGVPIEVFIEEFGYYGMDNYVNSIWFNGPIALCAGAIFLYIFLIWYRDWSGKGSFIYRLLMIPTSRMNIYFSKLTAIMLLVLSLVSIQLILLLIESKILKWFISADYLHEVSIGSLIKGSQFITVILPSTFTEFVLYYGAGFIALSILFTAILLERSFKWKGIILAILYCVGVIAVLSAPIILIELLEIGNYIYTSEQIIIVSVTASILGIISILLSRYLLNKKITV
ncbi:hypothetical protein F7984_13015 [Pradoshia sp. D12]|uniref:hypothetical protein n=1 Tax=Bacillaceae TaxID=186817 RepID=UPI00112DB062|nr:MULTISPECIES: hypothetical protein [Bacillaceae]QFK72087.1 hypothetical protein F7984_13015 [Pradoshia sp. D12]TPF71421.1 hypothetical protein FHY44_13185 [Bacillus sp. D12]